MRLFCADICTVKSIEKIEKDESPFLVLRVYLALFASPSGILACVNLLSSWNLQLLRPKDLERKKKTPLTQFFFEFH